MMWAIRLLFLAAIFGAYVFFGVFQVHAQTHDHPLRGPHPPANDDPYGTALSKEGIPCCHGVDCAEYYGPPPERVTRDGVQGWLFAGKIFMRDGQEIDPKTLRRDALGIASLCLNQNPKYWCFWYPRAG